MFRLTLKWYVIRLIYLIKYGLYLKVFINYSQNDNLITILKND